MQIKKSEIEPNRAPLIKLIMINIIIFQLLNHEDLQLFYVYFTLEM